MEGWNVGVGVEGRGRAWKGLRCGWHRAMYLGPIVFLCRQLKVVNDAFRSATAKSECFPFLVLAIKVLAIKLAKPASNTIPSN